MIRRFAATTAAVAFGVVALGACGSSGGSTSYVPPTGKPVKTIAISGSSYKFAPSKISAPAGILEFKLTSTDIQHSLRIKNVDGFQIEAGAGKTATGKVKLAPGTYTFYCDIPGHESSGMKGTLTVK
jgi:plastocyanin